MDKVLCRTLQRQFYSIVFTADALESFLNSEYIDRDPDSWYHQANKIAQSLHDLQNAVNSLMLEIE